MIRICMLLIILASLGIPAYSQSTLKTENVILISLDGLRWQEVFTGIDEKLMAHKEYVYNPEALFDQFWDDDVDVRKKKLLPFFWNTIAVKGQLYGNQKLGSQVLVTNGLYFSYPGYSEILTGYVDEGIDSNDKIWNPNKTVLEFVNNQPGFENKVAAFGSWDVFPYIINSKRSGIPVNAGFEPVKGDNLSEREIFLNELLREIPSPWSSVRFDAFTHHYAMETLKKETPRLLYVAYGETDDFAHDGNFEAYIKSARQTDEFISDLWEFVQNHESYRNKTTFILTTDHGRGTVPLETWKDHGSDIDGADEIWIAVIGPDTSPLGEIRNTAPIYQTQIARTVAHLLGLDYKNKVPVGDVIDTVINY